MTSYLRLGDGFFETINTEIETDTVLFDIFSVTSPVVLSFTLYLDLTISIW